MRRQIDISIHSDILVRVKKLMREFIQLAYYDIKKKETIYAATGTSKPPS